MLSGTAEVTLTDRTTHWWYNDYSVNIHTYVRTTAVCQTDDDNQTSSCDVEFDLPFFAVSSHPLQVVLVSMATEMSTG